VSTATGSRPLADREEYCAEPTRQEDEITKDFDAHWDSAMRQFQCGDSRWLATLNATISDLCIPGGGSRRAARVDASKDRGSRSSITNYRSRTD
jgi:hypothetical protein